MDRIGSTAQEVASIVRGSLRGDATAEICGVCTLANQRADCLAFAKDLERLKGYDPTILGVVLLVPHSADGKLAGTYICVENPRLAFALAMKSLFAKTVRHTVAATATIHPTAEIGPNVMIGERCIIGAGAKIGCDTELRNNVVIAERVVIGDRCLIRSNSVIGEEGFGFEKDGDGRYQRLPHLGSVVIGNDVEIGALTSVAAGTVDPTIIEDFARIDDLVHIAHNCRIGENAIITASVEIAGSVKLGRNVWLGPNCTIRNGLSVAPDITVGMGAVVIHNLTKKGTYAGSPAILIAPKID